MGDFKNAAMRNPEFRAFLLKHQDECLNVVIYAAFGFKNYAERDAVALLRLYNDREKK